MDVLKIAMIGLTGMCLAIPLRNYKPEYGMLVSMGTCIAILVYIVVKLDILVDYITGLEESLQIREGYIALLLKMLGITYVSQFASELCKDAGHAAISTQIELFGKLSVLYISMPILFYLLETVGEFL